MGWRVHRPRINSTTLIFNCAARTYRYAILAFYAVAPGATVDGAIPFRAGLGPGQANLASGVAAGSYDLYVTESGESVVLAGPIRIDVALGDVLDLVAFDAATASAIPDRHRI